MATLNLSMPEGSKDALKLAAKQTGAASISEHVREASPVYIEIYKTVARGGVVVLRDKDGVERILSVPRLVNPY